jgi:hypothetical protein
MTVEMGSGVPDSVRAGTVQLARALCTDAHLYGGHACLACQSAAWQLMARSGGTVAGPGLIASPPHGLSQRTCEAHWARLLADQAIATWSVGDRVDGSDGFWPAEEPSG